MMRKSEVKKTLGRPSCKWVNSIKLHLIEIGWGGVDWIGLAMDRNKWRDFMNAVKSLTN
jgi:hypothetical protein